MGRPRQPIKLIEAKGKSHKTKAEIKEREETEVRGECDMIMPLTFCTGICSSPIALQNAGNVPAHPVSKRIVPRSPSIRYVLVLE